MLNINNRYFATASLVTAVTDEVEKEHIMTIRQATINDCEALTPLFVQLANLHITGRPDIFKAAPKLAKKDFKKFIKSDNRYFTVAEINGEIIGISNWQLKKCCDNETLSDRTFAVIDEIIISESHRRKGYGKLLFEETVKLASEKGADSIELYVWNFNEDAKKFYEALGMKPQRTLLELKI